MNLRSLANSSAVSRRAFLVASSCGLAGFALGQPDAVAASSTAKAKSTILFFLCGGASHIDMWDMKPDAPADFRGPFLPIETSAPGVRLCEHLPMLAKQAHHLAVVNSVGATVNTNDHHAGYYYNLTGHVPDQSFVRLGNNRTPFPDDWPFMGSVVASRTKPNAVLPNAITLPHKPSKAPYTRPGQFAARIGVEYDPLYVNGNPQKPLSFQAPSLVLEGDITADRLSDRYSLLREIDAARRLLENEMEGATLKKHQERAISLLMSSGATRAFDVSQEPLAIRERYGQSINGMSLLLARRLAEVGVPFITVFWKEDARKLARKCASAGGWDTHSNNFKCLQENLMPEFDRCFSALVEDLSNRGMLDETLILVTSEMGRKPKIGDPRSGGTAGAGRDHWTHCLTDILAGGGIRGGQTYGSSDKRAEYPETDRVTPADITKTVYHSMGIHNLEATDKLGRPYNLLDEGEVISKLFG